MSTHPKKEGFVMDYTFHAEGSQGGIPLIGTFWCVGDDIVISPTAKRIKFSYGCWRSLADYKLGLPAIQGATRPYQADGQNFENLRTAISSSPEGTPVIGIQLFQVLNSYALATKDEHAGSNPQISFFENAVLTSVDS